MYKMQKKDLIFVLILKSKCRYKLHMDRYEHGKISIIIVQKIIHLAYRSH